MAVVSSALGPSGDRANASHNGLGFRFIGLVRRESGDLGLPILVYHAAGEVATGRVSGVDDVSSILEYLRGGPLDEVLTLLRRLVADFHGAGGPSRPLPADVRAMLEEGLRRVEAQLGLESMLGLPMSAYIELGRTGRRQPPGAKGLARS